MLFYVTISVFFEGSSRWRLCPGGNSQINPSLWIIFISTITITTRKNDADERRKKKVKVSCKMAKIWSDKSNGEKIKFCLDSWKWNRSCKISFLSCQTYSNTFIRISFSHTWNMCTPFYSKCNTIPFNKLRKLLLKSWGKLDQCRTNFHFNRKSMSCELELGEIRSEILQQIIVFIYDIHQT